MLMTAQPQDNLSSFEGGASHPFPLWLADGQDSRAVKSSCGQLPWAHSQSNLESGSLSPNTTSHGLYGVGSDGMQQAGCDGMQPVSCSPLSQALLAHMTGGQGGMLDPNDTPMYALDGQAAHICRPHDHFFHDELASPRCSLETSPTQGSPSAPKEGKRKVGRPIAYHGDPNAPHLTPAERRRMKRRIANRESARRVRARRQDELDAMAIKAAQMESYNAQLARAIEEAGVQHGALVQQAQHFAARGDQVAGDNASLETELAHLRRAMGPDTCRVQSRGLPSTPQLHTLRLRGGHLEDAPALPGSMASRAASGLLPTLEALMPPLGPEGWPLGDPLTL